EEPPMTVRFWIPRPLRSLTDGRAQIDVTTLGATLQDAFDALFAVHPGIRDRILTERAEIREHVNVFAGSSEARPPAAPATPLTDCMEFSIIAAISGGCVSFKSVLRIPYISASASVRRNHLLSLRPRESPGSISEGPGCDRRD